MRRPLPAKYKFVGRYPRYGSNEWYYLWQAASPCDQYGYVDVVFCPVKWFWSKPYWFEP